MWSKSLFPYKDVSPPVTQYHNHRTGPKEHTITTLNGFKAFLHYNPKAGDIVRYKHHANYIIAPEYCSIILSVEEDFNKVKWSHYSGNPEAHFITTLSNAKYNPNHFYPRAVDITEYNVLTLQEREELLKDANVQDYITRALAHYKEKKPAST